MKRTIALTFLFIVLALAYFAAKAPSNRSNCLTNGAVSYSGDVASAQVGKWLYRSGKDDWAEAGISENELITALNVINVSGPAMIFEHHSTRYATFELPGCTAVAQPVTVGFHCGETPNLGWVARRCFDNEG